MYAVVSTGGKQLKVEKGSEAVVEKLDVAVGEQVELDVVFLADGEEITTDAGTLSSASVTAEVMEHFKSDKVVVFKFKKRKGYKRTKGHRQMLTKVRIVDIAAGAPARKSRDEAGADEQPAETKPKATKKAAETKPKVTKKAAETKPKATAKKTSEEPSDEKPKGARAKKAAAEGTAEATGETEEAPE